MVIKEPFVLNTSHKSIQLEWVYYWLEKHESKL